MKHAALLASILILPCLLLAACSSFSGTARTPRLSSPVSSAAPGPVDTEEADRTTDSSAPSVSKASSSTKAEELLQCRFYNDLDFKASISSAKAGKPKTGSITGGVVPHHLLAADLIARFFQTVKAAEPDVIVVIAPNHKRAGKAAVCTGNWSWQTAFGTLDSDPVLTGYLEKEMSAVSNFTVLEEDHSVSALVPYIKYYMPSVKIVPILLYGNLGLTESQKLGKALAEQLKDRKSLVIASVDFSHYLTPEKAEEMDRITYDAIRTMNLEAISRMGNDNLDSPPSLMTLITYMKSTAASKPELLEHGNSSSITGKWSSSTTSYFTLVF